MKAPGKRMIMNMSEYAGSAFIKLDDVRGSPQRETIKDTKLGDYGRPNLVFESGNVLSLNKTNVRVLIKAYGEDSRDWNGCEVELSAGSTSYQGEERDSVRVKPVASAQANSL